MASLPSIARRAGNSAWVARTTFDPFPSELTVTVTPLWNRIAVQVDESGLLGAGESLVGEIDAVSTAGRSYVGTEFYKRYDADEYYANVFNVPEATEFSVHVTLRVIDDATGGTIATYREWYSTTTLSSETPQSAERIIYVDPVSGNNGNSGLTPALPKKYLDYGIQAGDTIVIKNGNFAGASFGQRAINEKNGTATNWIRIVPYSSIDPDNGDADAERFYVPVALNGPWTETSVGSGVWTMANGDNRSLGVVRDETTGWQLYHHNSLNSASASEPGILVGYDPADYPQLGGDEVQGWYIDFSDSKKIYIRTYNGLEPEADRYVGGYWTGLVIRESSYVSLEGLTFELLASTASSTALGGNNGLNIVSNDGNPCHHIYVKQCTFKDCVVSVTSTASQAGAVYDILFDEPVFLRKGPKEIFYDRVDYTDSEPYNTTLGYDPVKQSLWDTGGAIVALGVERLVIRNPDCYGYDLYAGNTTSTYATFKSGKNTDIYGGHCRASVVGVVDFGNAAATTGLNINSALWNMRIDHGAEPIAMSPANSGPLWIFNCYGDGALHTPFKIGIQNTGSGYSTDDGHAFKIIANNSFAMAGHTNSESLGVMRFQGAFSGVLATNNVIKCFESTEDTPIDDWFSYADPFTGGHSVEADRVNVWKNGVVYVQNETGSSHRPKLYWNSTTFDIADDPSDVPPAADIVWSNYDFLWSANGDVDPFPVSVAAGLNAATTRKSVGVRGITDLATVEAAALPIGQFTLRSA